MKPEPVTCGKCGYEFQSRSPHPQCRKCRSYDVLYVSMLSAAELQSVRVLVNVMDEGRGIPRPSPSDCSEVTQ